MLLSPQFHCPQTVKKTNEYFVLQQNSPRHEKQEKPVERIDDEEKRLLKLMGWTDRGAESLVSFRPSFLLLSLLSMRVFVFFSNASQTSGMCQS